MFDLIEKSSHVLFVIVGYIMKLAPIGAFGAMSFTIGKYGLGSLVQLGKLMGSFYLTCLLFIFIVLAASLSAVGHVPVAGLALILGIDRFMSKARALSNLIGNGVATLVVAKWTGDLDADRLQRRLDGETEAEADTPERVLDAADQPMVPAGKP